MLRTYRPKFVSIPVADHEPLNVRGLSLDDMARITAASAEIGVAFGELTAERLDDQDLRTILLGLLPRFPRLAALIIAAACDEPDEVDAAMQLPPATVLEALENIFVLTFKSETELRAVGERLTRWFLSASGALNKSSVFDTVIGSRNTEGGPALP